MPIARLDRTVFRLSGDNLLDWLGGLITNNLNEDMTFAALLTPQGKIIADFFVTKDKDNLLIDTPDKFSDDLFKRLRMYKLRAAIEIEKTNLCVYALWDGSGEDGHPDPRHSSLGQRLIADYMDTEHDESDYDAHRLSLGIPDSAFDFESSDVFPADANMDLLNGVDFKKGCFVGQEVVSRMHRKTEVKKRMRGFSFDGHISDTRILADARVVGEVLHQRDGYGMALIRLNRLEEYNGDLCGGETVIHLLEA